MRTSIQKSPGFTLVELIVVITILAILGTIGFLSLQGYSLSARDGERTSDMANISKGLEVLLAKGSILPMPDANMLTLSASWTVIGYQGYAGPNVQNAISFGGKGKDPLDGQYYTYLISSGNTKYQLLWLLEGSDGIALEIPGIETAYAGSYDARIPSSKGSSLGLLLWTGANLNQPAQEQYSGSFTGVDVANTTNSYAVYFSKGDIISWTGGTIGTPVQISFNNGGSGFGTPSECPSGFIPVPGNKELNQPGFCVAKYEMTYSDADTPNTCNGSCPAAENTTSQTDWNTVAYVAGKPLVSMAWKYPVANVSQTQAIAACKSLGTGYHLVTNNEWMTLARNIESIGDNWSTGISWSGWIFRGISGETSSSTSLGCNTANSAGKWSRNFVSRTLTSDTAKFSTNKGADCDSKRQHKLSNGEIVWDLSWNVYEHVNGANTVDGSNFSTMSPSVCVTDGYNSFYGNDGSAACSYINGYSYANIGPKIANLNGNNGIGRIYSYTSGGFNRVYVRGGSSDNAGGSVGIYRIDLDWSSSSSWRYGGFRCAK